jgi:hypothetical protein
MIAKTPEMIEFLIRFLLDSCAFPCATLALMKAP